MSNREWRDDEEDWSETGEGYDSGYDDSDNDDSQGDDDESIPCPECGAEIYSDLEHCPRCGHWLTNADRARGETGLFASRRVRLIAAVLLAIIVLSLLAQLALIG